MDLQYFCRSEKGKRDNNEDAFLAEKIGDCWIFSVADGLHDSVDKETIGEIVRAHEGDLSLVCDLLIAKALECGSDDNVTVVVVKGGRYIIKNYMELNII
jgi:serine/threonine protein phosphatase PrpC